jgi:hypothetical protein
MQQAGRTLNSEGRLCRKERDRVRKARILQEEEYPLVIDMKCMEGIPEAAYEAL